MKHTKFLALGLTIAVGGLALEVAAQRPAFTEIDSDKDGQVSLAEFLDMHAKRMTPEERFAHLDLDNNGFLSETELKKARGKRKPHGRRE